MLCLSGAVLLALSFPPFTVGVIACIAFVPFLLLADALTSWSRYFHYTYGMFFVFSLLALYWVGGFTHMQDPYLMIAGIALFFWEPLVLTLPCLVYFWIKRKLNFPAAALLMPFLWVSMEWLYALGELAFPWLHMGNTQTYHLEKIQFVDLTGVYGVSFWVLMMNVLIYWTVKNTFSGAPRRQSITLAASSAILYILPNFYQPNEQEIVSSDRQPISVGIVQPNVDPWKKWEGGNTFAGRWAQVQQYQQLIRSNLNDSLDLVVLPESAILLNLPAYYSEMQQFRSFFDSANISLISGYVKVQYYEPDNAPPTASVVKGTTLRYDSFNSIFFIEPHRPDIQTYSKMRLVPFAERIPYADQVPFLIEPLRWGVGISNWGLAKDSVVFGTISPASKFLAMVCYESIFPEFVASFVNKGAEFLVFITNDSWWGNTSGARQHNQFAVLRAIENRRWVVRCANGGISSFIDPMGRMFDQTEMYTQDFRQRTIQPLTYSTFYSRNGDWFARICMMMSVVFIFISTVYRFLRK